MSDKPSKKSSKSKRPKHELSVTDLQFLKAVDHVIEANKKAGRQPDKITAISKAVYGNPSAISRVKSAERGITIPQLMAFATYFSIDYNFFFRGDAELFYDPKKPDSPHQVVKGSSVVSSGYGNTVINAGEGGIRGNVRTGGMDNVFARAEKLILSFAPEEQEKCMNILRNLQVQHDKKVENLIIEKSEELKKNSEIYEQQLKLKDEQLRLTEKRLDQALVKNEETFNKYVDLLEKLEKQHSASSQSDK